MNVLATDIEVTPITNSSASATLVAPLLGVFIFALPRLIKSRFRPQSALRPHCAPEAQAKGIIPCQTSRLKGDSQARFAAIDVRVGGHLRENVREQRMRRIVFSLFFF